MVVDLGMRGARLFDERRRAEDDAELARNAPARQGPATALTGHAWPCPRVPVGGSPVRDLRGRVCVDARRVRAARSVYRNMGRVGARSEHDEIKEVSELGRIAACHGASLERRALRLLRDPDEARDLVQETYARALERTPPWLSERHALGWLRQVLHNLALDRLRLRRRRPHVDLQQIPELTAPPLEPLAAPCVEHEQLCACAARLTPALRDVYRLHDLEGVSYREIGARLQIPLNTVGTRLRRARRKLRELLLAAQPSAT